MPHKALPRQRRIDDRAAAVREIRVPNQYISSLGEKASDGQLAALCFDVYPARPLFMLFRTVFDRAPVFLAIEIEIIESMAAWHIYQFARAGPYILKRDPARCKLQWSIHYDVRSVLVQPLLGTLIEAEALKQQRLFVENRHHEAYKPRRGE